MEDAITEMDGLVIRTEGKRTICRSVLWCAQSLDDCKFAISDEQFAELFSLE